MGIKIKNKTLFVYNDDHYYEIRRLYDKDDIDGKDMFLVLMINAYRTPKAQVQSSKYITQNIFSYEQNRNININDLDKI